MQRQRDILKKNGVYLVHVEEVSLDVFESLIFEDGPYIKRSAPDPGIYRWGITVTGKPVYCVTYS